MFASQLDIRLILMMGETIPLPAPTEVMSALKSVEVTSNANGNDGFQMSFSLSKDTIIDYGLLASGVLRPDSRVVIGVMLGGIPEALIDGVICHHQSSPSNEPGMSTLTVSGRDISVLMELEEKNEKYENLSDSMIVSQIIMNYAGYGIFPQATTTTDVPLMVERIPRQQETDLAFLKRLAKRNAFVFYIEPLTIGTSTAYFGPEDRLSVPQSALTVNMNDATNVKSLQFTNDALAPIGTEGTFIEPFTRMSIPIPPLPPLHMPPLAATPMAPMRTKLTRTTANQNPAQAFLSALSAASEAPDAVDATGELDTLQYGHVLRARRLVGVRGAGYSYDGTYKVSRVTHRIKQGEYTQSFQLKREGTGALLPVVMP